LLVFFALLGFARAKAALAMFVKLTTGRDGEMVSLGMNFLGGMATNSDVANVVTTTAYHQVQNYPN